MISYQTVKFMKMLAVGAMSISCLITPVLAAQSATQMPNIPMPTLGGKQVWADEYVYAGWRIQQNIYTKHFRLLDPLNTRRAWGDFEACKSALDEVRVKTGLKPKSSHMVLLVHGIARSTGTFSQMQETLSDKGYDAIAISYPSTRASIEDHAKRLETLLNNLEGTQTVSFVTHSMGGLVVRQLLAGESPWKDKVNVHRIVQIAPPNQGSAVARWLEDFPPYTLFYGTAGEQLTPSKAQTLPSLKYPFGIIAGGKGDGEGFNPLLPGDDDGTVMVHETKLKGSVDFRIVPAIHAKISNDPETINATLKFLKFGRFN